MMNSATPKSYQRKKLRPFFAAMVAGMIARKTGQMMIQNNSSHF
jgi:hypothetical protein